ncbi:peptidoglycan glycosyltransferase [Anaerosporomusa subterranea]|uniref:Peptidoglycan glycosyltransferase n=1 Tax=Anaerosporomusa subterranea TaxID=1794912 RepID=A0A154BUJ8_ANASB|nr:penicillin-binding protein 2 [Anaerosporomusa subterranea]KYZ77535.1 peptidoglycan glycosyltransferase [Anaerosporomusa subterranea]
MAFSVSRLRKLFFIVTIGVFAIFGRLFFLQVIETDKLSIRALESRIVEAPANSIRGDILDRNGLPLTGTVGQSYLFVFPAQIYHLQKVCSNLVDLGVDSVELRETLATVKQPFKWKYAIDQQTANKINEAALPGVIAVTEKKRYSLNGLAAHVLGYINAADNQGVSGLEASFDSILRGHQTTYIAAMVDAGQRIIPGLGYKRIHASEGRRPGNIVLTIDKRIQTIVESVLDQSVSKGAVIIMNPVTGEILAMASRPNFDADHLELYLNHQSAPLLNRAIVNYQPGSVFKLAVAAAALEQQLVKPQDTFFDNGYIEVNSIRFRGWDYEKGARGKITFTEAMAYSSNPVFIELGLKVGAKNLLSYARKLGFGQLSGIGLQGEAGGTLPDAAAVFSADLANLSIGQGTLEASPLQVVGMVSAIANGGILRQPVLVSRLINHDGSITVVPQGRPPQQVMSAPVAAQMREMMKAVTEYGTGAAAQVEKLGSAGKTGSAETGRLSQGKSINHAWFAGFAPAANPKFAAVVFIEEGMSGGDIAAPLFREIMERILTQQP